MHRFGKSASYLLLFYLYYFNKYILGTVIINKINCELHESYVVIGCENVWFFIERRHTIHNYKVSIILR